MEINLNMCRKSFCPGDKIYMHLIYLDEAKMGFNAYGARLYSCRHDRNGGIYDCTYNRSDTNNKDSRERNI